MMLFRKSKAEDSDYPFPGIEQALDGHSAVRAVEQLAADAVVIQSATDVAEDPLRDLAPEADATFIEREAHSSATLGGLLAGHAAGGLRTGAIVGTMPGLREMMYSLAGKQLPVVINLTSRAAHRQGLAHFGGHDAYYDVGGTGAFLMFAANAQEAADFSLIAHRIAEQTLTPGVCAQDLYRTSHGVQSVRLPDADFVGAFLGDAGDNIDAVTPAQATAFGKVRRRVPRLVDVDHPSGVGGSHGESYFKSVLAQRMFFGRHVQDAADEAFRHFGELTGRHYGRLHAYRAEDAEFLVVAQGAVLEELRTIADSMRTTDKIKVGVIAVSMFDPFPGAELSRLLAGRKAVTVLDRCENPLSDDTPLVTRVRCTLDKSLENAAAPAGDQPHPDFARTDLSARPQIFTGIYGVGAPVPPRQDLTAVVHNMTAAHGRVRRFYIGVDLKSEPRRFPHLHSLRQLLNRDYPEFENAALPVGTAEATGDASVMILRSLSAHGGLFAGNLFAQVMWDALQWPVRTFPAGGLEPVLQSAELTIMHATAPFEARSAPSVANTALVATDALIDDLVARSAIAEAGCLIVGSPLAADDLWRKLPGATARWIRDRAIRLYTVDTRAIAAQSCTNPSFVDQLALWSLLGAYLHTLDDLDDDGPERVAEQLKLRLEQLLGAAHPLVNDIIGTVASTGANLTAMDWTGVTEEDIATAVESQPPWAVQQSHDSSGSVFDLNRFWHSVGYLYESGESRQTLADPYTAGGIVPARSAGFRDMTPYRLRLPHWLPENCTGCGMCWAMCPDSALPPSTHGVDELLQTGMAACASEERSMTQLKRLSTHLAKFAHRLFADDGLNRYTTLGPLFDDAYAQLVEKLDVGDDDRDALAAEFNALHAHWQHYPVAKTDVFFDRLNAEQKGAGRLLTIALNPLSCKGCGLCVDVCPDGAMDWQEQDAEQIEAAQATWQRQVSLPGDTPEWIDQRISHDDSGTQVHRLLSRDAYHSVVGGDDTFPGSVAKTAVHLVTAAVESTMAPRFRAHTERLGKLIKELEAKIQGTVASTLKINDFEDFDRRMSRLRGSKELGPEQLAAIAGSRDSVDATQLARLTSLLNQLIEQERLYAQGADGRGRSRMVMTFDGAGAVRWSGTYPYNPHVAPWLCHASGASPAAARALFDAVTSRLVEELRLVRLAALALQDDDGPLETLSWTDLSADERRLIPPVVVLLDDSAIDWDVASRLLSIDAPVIMVLVSNRSPYLQPGVDTATSAHSDVFELHGSVGNPGHLIEQVMRGLAHDGPSLFHIYASDPVGDGIAPEAAARQSRLAFESRAFPLFAGVGNTVRLDGNPDLTSDWTTHTLTFQEPSGAQSTIDVPLTPADWAVGETRFHDHFRFVSKGHLGDRMKPLWDYIDLKPDARESFEPFIHVVGAGGKHVLAIVDAAIVSATDRARAHWRELSRGTAVAAPTPPPAQPQPEPAPAETEHAVYAKVTDRLLWLCGYGRDPDFFKQSLREFIVEKRRGTTPEE